MKIYSYEGWFALYRDGVKLMESDDLSWIVEKYTDIEFDHDGTAYDWHDDPEIGCFPESLDNQCPGR